VKVARLPYLDERLRKREEIPLGDFPTKFFKNLPQDDVAVCLRMLRDEGLPVGRLRARRQDRQSVEAAYNEEPAQMAVRPFGL
jgi:hypothetical protein